MKDSTQHNTPCQKANNQLMDMLSNQDLDEKMFASLCEANPDCIQSLQDIKTAWDDLGDFTIPEPPSRMQDQFFQSLQSFEAHQSRPSNWIEKVKAIDWSAPLYRWSSMALLFVAGIAIGYLFKGGASEMTQSLPIATNESPLQQQTFVALKNDRSVSERLKGVQLARQLEKPNEVIINALNKALLYDPNVNVRLSAIESMLFFSEQPKVRSHLVKAIPLQTSPLVQLALAEAMLVLQEKSAVDELEQLIQSDHVEIEVKKELEKTVQILL